MSNFVIKMPESVKIGAVGASEAACTDVGSVAEVTVAHEADNEMARSSKLHGQVVEVVEFDPEDTVTFICEEITGANVATAFGAVVDGTTIKYSGSGGTPTYKTIYVRGQDIDGVAKVLHVKKAYIQTGSELQLGREQQTLEITAQMLALTSEPADEQVFKYSNASADTTAPTISSSVPADGATGVAKAVSTTFSWTFSEPVRSEDINDKHFFITDDSGNVKAGALTTNATNDVVTFTPGTAWAATTKYLATCVKGVKDVGGNELAATDVRDFTTGA